MNLLSQMKAMGGFAPDKTIKREVKFKKPVLRPEGEWADPEIPEETGEVEDATITVFIRRGSAADAFEINQAAKREQPFVVIHRAIVHEDGTPVFESVEQAMRLQLWLAMPLFEAVMEAAPAAPKSSRRKKSGGANSR